MRCIRMFRRVNNQPGIHKILKFMLLLSIYLWLISPFDKPSGSWFIISLTSMGELVWYFWKLHISNFLKHLKTLLKSFSFYSASFFPKDTESMEGNSAQIVKVET